MFNDKLKVAFSEDFLGQITVPIVATFYLTSMCNLHCRYCYEYGKTKVPDMKKEQISLALNGLNSMHLPIEAIFLFGGEPTLRLDLCKFAMKEATLFQDMNPTRKILFTNGMRVSTEMLSMISAFGMEVFFSFDGFHERSYERYGANIEEYTAKALENIKLLVQVSKCITISIALGKHNIMHIWEDIQRLSYLYGIQNFKINTIRKERFAASNNELAYYRNIVMDWARTIGAKIDWDPPEVFGSIYDNIYISSENIILQKVGEHGEWKKVSW